MNGYSFAFAGTTLTALPSGALWWDAERILVVADLHLGKSERVARLGGTLLPPYEVTDTLLRLDDAVTRHNPATVICLGDSFDDSRAADLGDDARLWLARLMAGRRWIWISGNHDPLPVTLGGECRAELTLTSLTFRHIADPATTAELSGHYHPKIGVGGRTCKCFLTNRHRIILPAFGTYTGGMFCDDAPLAALAGDGAFAILTGSVARPVPVSPQRSPRATTSR